MAGNPCVQCRVAPSTKTRLRAIAQEHQLTESALLKRLVETALLQTAGTSGLGVSGPIEPVSRGARLYVRLRPEDHVLLRERAAGRAMAAATYASFLLRAHLRAVAPMPDGHALVTMDASSCQQPQEVEALLLTAYCYAMS